MRRRFSIALLAAAAFAITPAAAQDNTGVPPESASREADGDGNDGNFWYNLIGLVGLLGLRGLWRDSDNDGYTDDPV